jgi:diacylglycerol kinase family enzyme
MAGIKAMTRPQSTIQVTSDHGVQSGELVLVGNGRHYGGPWVLFPRADMQDGLLDVLIYPRINWESFFEIGHGYLTHQVHTAAGAHYFQTANFTLTSAEPTPFELDGDNVGHLPVTFSIRPRALRVLTPGPFFL